MIPQELYQQAKTLITNAKHVLVIPSSPPDGDSLGSALALYIVLKKLNKEATVVCADPIPDVYGFLPQANVIESDFQFTRSLIVTLDYNNAEIDHIDHHIEPNKVNVIITPKRGKLSAEDVRIDYGNTKYDLIITVDAGDVSQFGKIYENNTELFHLVPVINIDHHVSNTQFGKLNLVDVMASSASSILMRVIETMDKNLVDPDVATLLLAGLITDTGSFQNPNTTPDSFAVAAHLIERGARQQEIIQHVYKTKKMSTLKLWGRVLSKIQHDAPHRFVWSTLSKEDFEEVQASPDETEGVIDELMTNAPDCEVVLLLKHKDENVVSGSLRTTTPLVDARKIAEHFGGGGHLQAAGFKMHNISLAEAEKAVVGYIRELQANKSLRSPALALAEAPEKFTAVEAAASVQKKPSTLTNLMRENESSKPVNPAAGLASPFPTPLDMRMPATAPNTELSVPAFNPVATPDELV